MMKPEILAPAGKTESLKAAVQAGCDAVYLGGDCFSARAFAGNFSKEELLSAIDYCHLFGVKVYLTVNTLFKDDELNDLVSYLEPFYKEGLDAVLVQDMGVYKKLKEAFPYLPLHASTQTSITTPEGARLFKSLGFERIVPARELSLEQIKQIKEKVDIEVETFVHGAMCFSYSGRCLFSSFLGGRSGNRGRCAQPCRRIYELVDKEKLKSKEYIMSLKDMCALEMVPELIEAGVDSFKIEGRMKNPLYVAGTVSAYRRARNLYFEIGKKETEEIGNQGKNKFRPFSEWTEKERKVYDKKILEMKQELLDIYNRGGFSKGYFNEHNGKDMLASKRPNHEGVLVGKVKKIDPPFVYIETERRINKQDVLEIRPLKEEVLENPSFVELTSGEDAEKGNVLRLNGKEFKKIKTGAKVYRTRNNQLLNRIEKEVVDADKTISANAEITAQIGKPFSIRIFDGKVSSEALGEIVEAASNRPTSKEDIENKVLKTGGTMVSLKINSNMDEDIFVPLSKVNNLRREAIENFKKAKIKEWKRLSE